MIMWFQKKAAITSFTLESVWQAIRISILVRSMKLSNLVALFESKAQAERPNTIGFEERLKVLDCISNFKYFVIRSNCLRKSLLHYSMLLKTGVEGVRFCVGILKEDGKLEGHSWLMLNGQPFLESEENIRQYHITFSSEINHVTK